MTGAAMFGSVGSVSMPVVPLLPTGMQAWQCSSPTSPLPHPHGCSLNGNTGKPGLVGIVTGTIVAWPPLPQHLARYRCPHHQGLGWLYLLLHVRDCKKP